MNFRDANQHAGLPEGRVNIQGLKKPSNIRNDKELESEITRICETLKDTCKYYFSEFFPHFMSLNRLSVLEFEIHLNL